jgi:NADH-quinone oxidoreductase subunit L
MAMLALGGGLGYLFYISRRLDPASVGRSGPFGFLYDFLWNRWYLNPIYYRVFVYGTISAASGLWKRVELGFFDKISGAAATFSVGLSRGGQRVDLGIVDGAINGIAGNGRRISSRLKNIQTGILQDYVTVFALGLFVLVVVALFFFS